MINPNLREIGDFKQLNEYIEKLEAIPITYNGKRKFRQENGKESLAINQLVQKLHDQYNEKYFKGAIVSEQDLVYIDKIIEKIHKLDDESYTNLRKCSLFTKINHWFASHFGMKIKTSKEGLFRPGYSTIQRNNFLREIQTNLNEISEKHYLSHIIKTDLNEQVQDALETSYNDHYKKAFTDAYRKREAKWTLDNETIHRYNHGLAHATRKAYFIPFIIDYFKRHSTDALSTKLAKLIQEQGEEKVIAKLQIVMAFEVAGRNSECGSRDNLSLYTSYLIESKKAFKTYCYDKDLVGESKLFKNEYELEQYAQTIPNKYPNKFKKEEDMDVLTAIVDSSHTLDEFRCYWPSRMKEEIETINTFYTKDKNNRDLWNLAKFCQQTVKITGDRLMTEFADDKVRHRNMKFKTSDLRSKLYHNFNLTKIPTFVKCSKDAKYCWEILKAVPAPVSYSRGETTYSYLEEQRLKIESKENTQVQIDDIGKSKADKLDEIQQEAIETSLIDELKSIISQTQAAIRLVNTKNRAFDYEMSMLNDPVHKRPLRKVSTDRDYVLVERSKKKVVQRGYKKRIPLMNQRKMHNLDRNSLNSNQPEPVHLSNDRGKAKFTPYTKKLSLSLLRKDGKVKHFEGQWPTEYYIYNPIGMLYNMTQLHQKSEKFIFDYDVSTTSKFWIGQDAASTVEDKIGREKDLTLQDLQDKLNKEVEEGIEPQNMNFFKMQHASNEILMGASKAALKALFSVEDKVKSRLQTFTYAVYLAQDYGKKIPTVILDGKNTPRVYSRSELHDDLKLIAQSKNRIDKKNYKKLLLCFYSFQEIESKKPTYDDLYKKCEAFMDLSILPLNSTYLK